MLDGAVRCFYRPYERKATSKSISRICKKKTKIKTRQTIVAYHKLLKNNSYKGLTVAERKERSHCTVM